MLVKHTYALTHKMTTRSFSWESIICGHYIYKEIWTPLIGEVLTVCTYDKEHGNSDISIMNNGEIVGYVPRE